MKDQPQMHFEQKGWGFERWIVNKPEYCGKLLYIAKNRKCSLHYHKLKDEMFYLQSGEIKIYYSDDLQKLENINEYNKVLNKNNVPVHYWDICDSITLHPGDNFYVPPGRVHQIIGVRDSELFEFSTQHFESDSFRLISGD